jgi:hypothetical protein
MSAAAAYTFDAGDRPEIPGATWADGHPGPAPNTPLPGLPVKAGAYVPLDVSLRRTYEDDDHGWIEVRRRHSDRGNWRGKKSRGFNPPKQTLDELLISLGGKSYVVV